MKFNFHRSFLISTILLACISHGISNEVGSDENSENEAAFFELDNYMNKGSPEIFDGKMSIDKDKIKFTANGKDVFAFNLITLYFACDGHLPCSLPQFKTYQNKFLEPPVGKQWQEHSLSCFKESFPQINLDTDCLVIVSDIPGFPLSNIVLACMKQQNLVEQVKEKITTNYNNKVKELKEEDYVKAFEDIPFTNPAQDIKISYIVASTQMGNHDYIPPAKSVINALPQGLVYNSNRDFLVKFLDLIEIKSHNIRPKEIAKFSIRNFPKSFQQGEDEIDPACCFEINNTPSDLIYYICARTKSRCFFEKITLIKFIHQSLERLIGREIKKRDKEERSPADDTFDFGLSAPPVKQLPDNFNFNNLNDDTFNNSLGGEWEGWVYEASLTMRDYNKKVTPVFMKIKDGELKFTLENDDNEKPYKTLPLYQYNQQCLTHCKPKEYIGQLRESKESNYDDVMNLQRAIENVLTHNHNWRKQNGCVVMDFMAPLVQMGYSNIICAADNQQGDNLREAINVAYYKSILNLDIRTHIRTPFRDNDKYYARIIRNNTIDQEYNTFSLTLNGIKGQYRGNQQQLDKKTKTMIFFYKEIAGDNFGEQCALWYRNLRIKQRGEESDRLIQDNNCCFRFFSNSKEKIEICTYNIDGKICIKQAMELMKGVKEGCELIKKATR